MLQGTLKGTFSCCLSMLDFMLFIVKGSMGIFRSGCADRAKAVDKNYPSVGAVVVRICLSNKSSAFAFSLA